MRRVSTPPSRPKCARRSRPAAKPTSWRIFGIEVRKDIPTLVALMGTVFAAGYAMYAWIRGPDLKLLPPEQVIIYGEPYKKGDAPYLRIISRMTYVNDGEPGYSGIVTREWARIYLDDRGQLPCIYQRWHENVKTKLDIENHAVTADKKDDSRPFVIAAGSTESHETLFMPYTTGQSEERLCPEKEISNFSTMDEFVKLSAKTMKKDGERYMVVELGSDIYRKDSLTTRCKIRVDNAFLERIKKTGWHAPSCISDR